MGSLGSQILFWMATVSLLPLLVMAWQGYATARKAIVSLQEDQLHALLDVKLSRLESILSDIRADIHVLAGDSCVQGECAAARGCAQGNPASCRAAEGCARRLDPRGRARAYDSIALYTPDWTMLKCSALCRRTQAPMPPAEFRKLLAGAREPVLRHLPHADSPTMVFGGMRMEDESGQLAGYIVVSMDLARALTPVLQDPSGLGETGAIHLLDSSGSILAGGPHTETTVGTPSGIPLTSRDVREYWSPRGKLMLGAVTPLPELGGWFLAVEKQHAEAFRWLGPLRTGALVSGLLTLIVVLVIATRCSRSLSHPLRRLADLSRAVAAGDTAVRAHDLGGTEAQEVAQAFNRMLDELEASQKKLVHAASLAAVGEISSSVAHEIRNPLSSVQMNLQALRRKVAGDEAFSEMATIALEQVRRIDRMLSDLLGYGKPLTLHPVATPFAVMARNASEAARGELEAGEVLLELRDQTQGRPLPVDPEHFSRLITNLLTNAAHASAPGGTVELAAFAPENGGPFRITVRDYGSGVPSNMRDKLFQPFFTTRENGTGLGLANVKKIAEYHGGTASFEDAPGGGALFTVTIPARGGTL